MSAKWTDQQKTDYDEWAAHFETYQKWLSKKPQEHQLFNMSVRNIKRKSSVEYYRGFLESIAHIIAAIQNSLESEEAKKEVGIERLKQTFNEYCHALIGYLSDNPEKKKISTNNDDDDDEEKQVQETSLIATVNRAVPAGKPKDFYVGFRDGCEQMTRLITTVYDEKKHIDQPFNVLKTIFIIQSGFCIGLMVENWPTDRIPKYKRAPP